MLFYSCGGQIGEQNSNSESNIADHSECPFQAKKKRLEEKHNCKILFIQATLNNEGLLEGDKINIDSLGSGLTELINQLDKADQETYQINLNVFG